MDIEIKKMAVSYSNCVGGNGECVWRKVWWQATRLCVPAGVRLVRQRAHHESRVESLVGTLNFSDVLDRDRRVDKAVVRYNGGQGARIAEVARAMERVCCGGNVDGKRRAPMDNHGTNR